MAHRDLTNSLEYGFIQWRPLHCLAGIAPGHDVCHSAGAMAVCYGPGMSEVETARLLLRPWQPEDLAEFTRLLTDPVVTRYIVVSTPFSPEDVAELSARTLDEWDRNGFGPWAAMEKATGRWVGRIGLNELPDWPGSHKVEVGWELHREFWGRGLATEGGLAGVRYGFETVGLERIISVTMATNAASRRVMEKCGLRFQGELPMAGTVVAWYAVNRVEWQAGHVAVRPEAPIVDSNTRNR